MTVNENGGLLVGFSVWGVLRGLETFSQLVYNFNNTNKLAINKTMIEDMPRYAFRGIMLDTVRHYYPVNYKSIIFNLKYIYSKLVLNLRFHSLKSTLMQLPTINLMFYTGNLIFSIYLSF